MTKDELENNLYDAIWDSIFAESGEVRGGHRAADKCIDIAEDYAKQEAIEFSEWAAEKGWEKHFEENTWFNRMGYVTEYTTEKLYELYQQSKTITL